MLVSVIFEIFWIVVVLLVLAGFVIAVNSLRKFYKNFTTMNESWKDEGRIAELVTLYSNIALEYGPESQEAKDFRFEINVKEWWGKNDVVLKAFERIVEHFDRALLANDKLFSWGR